ncbi:hypothetical protein BJX70DRAFT_137689 [Aspergillus crustosus]
MPNLTSLPTELLHIILGYFEDASDVNALTQTSRRLSHIATSPYLYPRLAQACPPEGLNHLIETRNLATFRKMISTGVDLSFFYRYNRTSKEFMFILLELHGVSFFENNLNSHDHVLMFALETYHEGLLRLFNLKDFPESKQDMLMLNIASTGPVPSVQLLLDSGFAPDRRDGWDFPLLAAADEGHLDVVKLLLRYGADPNREAYQLGDEVEDPNTPLHCAAINGHRGVVEILLDAGACFTRLRDRNTVRGDLDDVDFYAADREFDARGIANIVKTLRGGDIAALIVQRTGLDTVVNGADTEACGHLVTYAAAVGDGELVRRLLERTSDIIDTDERYPEAAALSLAVYRQHPTILNILLDKIAEAKPGDFAVACYCTITTAILEGATSLLIELLNRGDEPLLRSHGAKILTYALHEGTEEICYLLAEYPMFLAFSTTDEVSMLKTMLPRALQLPTSGVFFQMLDASNLWPCDVDPSLIKNTIRILQIAAQHGSLDVFTQLLTRNPSAIITLNPEDPGHKTLLSLATAAQNLDLINLFVTGCNFPTNALYQHKIERMIPLLHHAIPPADISTRSSPRSRQQIKDFTNPPETKAMTIISYLLDHGADINAVRDNLGSATALALAVRNSHKTLVLDLLSRGADPLQGGNVTIMTEKQKPRRPYSALQMALRNARYDLVRILLDHLISTRDPRCDEIAARFPPQIQWWDSVPVGIKITDRGSRALKAWHRVWDDEDQQAQDQEEDWGTAVSASSEVDGVPWCLDAFALVPWWRRVRTVKEVRRFMWSVRHPVPDVDIVDLDLSD